ncbi:MAG: FliM/FliN family flagellar motor switch protein [Firmicutes bacterium]|nr:FliM/FliN family flagellar motor switch protein [Bacillota bacterium]
MVAPGASGQEILSQEQIDALVSALGEGVPKKSKTVVPGKEQKPIRVYDFRSPDKLTKENLRNLNLIYDDFSRMTGNSLSVICLRTSVDMNVSKTDQLPFGEIMFGEKEQKSGKANPEIFSIFNLSPLPGSALLQMDIPLLFAIMDRMLGGPGWGTSKIRALTQVEKELTQEILKKILLNLREVWRKYRELTPRVLVLESDPRLVPRVIAFHDTMVRTIFVVTLGETFGLMKLSLPYVMLNPLLTLVEKEEGGSHPIYRQQRDYEEALGWLGKIQLPLTIELGSASVTAKEIFELEAGHVISFEKKATAPLDVKVGEKMKFAGQLGAVGERKAIQITKIIQEGQENG